MKKINKGKYKGLTQKQANTFRTKYVGKGYSNKEQLILLNNFKINKQNTAIKASIRATQRKLAINEAGLDKHSAKGLSTNNIIEMNKYKVYLFENVPKVYRGKENIYQQKVTEELQMRLESIQNISKFTKINLNADADIRSHSDRLFRLVNSIGGDSMYGVLKQIESDDDTKQLWDIIKTDKELYKEFRDGEQIDIIINGRQFSVQFNASPEDADTAFLQIDEKINNVYERLI